MTGTRRNLDRRYIKDVREKAGNVCANCGATENIEYHHIVPLFVGGKEIDSNIVPLCHRCHKAAHHGRNIQNYAKATNPGRKPNVSDEQAFKAFDLFSNGEIGRKKCKELIGISQTSQVKGTSQYIKYLKIHGIKSIKNNIDIAGTNSTLEDGKIVGKITYLDGTEKPLTYKDTGKNDVEYIHRKFH